MMDSILSDIKTKMQRSLEALAYEFNKIRTGRANPSILDSIKVDYYGNSTPINQTANITVEEGRTLSISPWDKSMIGEIEKAILKSDLGLSLIHISEPTRHAQISYAVFCLKKKK